MPRSFDSDRRLLEIARVIQALARLDFSQAASVGPRGDTYDAVAAGVNALGEELSAFQAQVEERAQALAAANDELTHRSLYDGLTGLANRALFHDRLTRELAALADGGPRMAVLALDLDEFKAVNDTLGHASGDEMLAEVGKRLIAGVRRRDTAARIGGDEFAVLLTDIGRESALKVAAKVADMLSAPFELDGRQVHASASVGLAFGEPGQEAEEVQQNADVALYAAKRSRSGHVEVYEASLHAAVVKRQMLISELRGAVLGKEIAVFYQPIVRVSTRQIVGFEALARWHHQELGDIPPSTFIPLAEQIGLMPELGITILESACRQAASWRRPAAHGGAPYVAVNLSAIQLQDPQFASRLRKILRVTHLAPARLEVEITESQLVEGVGDAIGSIQTIRDMGIRVAIDDFGTGYSSLTYLRTMPVDTVKIDRSFVAGIGTGSEEWSFAQSIVRMVRSLSLLVVAEGVETAAQLAHAQALGCDLAQGYYLGRPMPPEAVGKLLLDARTSDGMTSAPRALPRAPAVGSRPRSAKRGPAYEPTAPATH